MTARSLHPGLGTAAGSTLLTLAAVLSGCSAGASTQPGNPPQTGAQSQTRTGASPRTPAATPAAASSAPAGRVWTALKDSAPYKALTAEQQQKISTLESMDVDTFGKQARDDQLAYGAFLREVYQKDATAGTAPAVPNPAATNVSRTSAGAEIIDDERLKAATARWSVQADPDISTSSPASPGTNYTKMAPSRVSPLYPAAFAEASAPAGPAQGAVLAGLSDPQRMLLVDESNNFIPYDGSMEQLEFKVLEMQSTETRARNQLYFAYTPFTDIHGVTDGVWILMLNAQESQERWIPDLSVID